MSERYLSAIEHGLTSKEVDQRLTAGLKNEPLPPLTRSVKQIFRDNLLTLFNCINVLLAGLVLLTGSYKNMLFLFVVIVNTAIGIFQEIRAKRQVDKLSLLSATKVKVRRDGQTLAIAQDEIVQDDLLLVTRGEQLPVDGLVRETSGLEVDESQITGEADPVIKGAGDELGRLRVASSSLNGSNHGARLLRRLWKTDWPHWSQPLMMIMRPPRQSKQR